MHQILNMPAECLLCWCDNFTDGAGD